MRILWWIFEPKSSLRTSLLKKTERDHFQHAPESKSSIVYSFPSVISTSMAALRPLIAITLPPGCVQAPHR